MSAAEEAKRAERFRAAFLAAAWQTAWMFCLAEQGVRQADDRAAAVVPTPAGMGLIATYLGALASLESGGLQPSDPWPWIFSCAGKLALFATEGR